jgi:DNA invertase Pin-like site-specific DNA recombinase
MACHHALYKTTACRAPGGRHERPGLDANTTTAAGKLLFHITGAFAEFERATIRERVKAGMGSGPRRACQKSKYIARRSGIVRRSLGRPGAEPEKLEKVKELLPQGVGILKTAKTVRLGTGTVQKLKDASQYIRAVK